MKAIVHERFGVAHLELRDTAIPEPADGQVLVRVRATSVNPIEYYEVYAPPFIRVLERQPRRPKDPRLGTDVAGTVESVGSGVAGVGAGDEVFGVATGAWAEYAVATAARIAPKPQSIPFEDAAALPIAAITALQAVRDVGCVRAGQSVLVNGGSGGVGTYAIQLAKHFGAKVTAVCSTGNVEQARELGADRVIDYRAEDFTKGTERYEVLLDVAGSRSIARCRRVLATDATVVLVGGRMRGSALGPLTHLAGSMLGSVGRSQRARLCFAKVGTDDLVLLAGLLEEGALRSVIDRRFTLDETPEALRYLAQGHARGKVVVTV